MAQTFCYINDGQTKTTLSPVQLAAQSQQLGVGEILLNSINQGGMMNGYDLKLVRSVTDAVQIPVIACGGCGSINGLKNVLDEGGAHAAAAGSFFVYYGRAKAILITAPSEHDFLQAGIYEDD